MSEVTLESIAKVMRSELEPIQSRLASIEETVTGHSSALVEMAKDLKDIKNELTVQKHITEKHENAINFVAEKVGVVDKVKQLLQA